MRTDVPIATPDWLLADAIRAMDDAGTDRLAVCAGDQFIGVLTSAALVQLAEILDLTDTACAVHGQNGSLRGRHANGHRHSHSQPGGAVPPPNDLSHLYMLPCGTIL